MEIKHKLSFGLMRLPVRTKLTPNLVDQRAVNEMADWFLKEGYRHFDTSVVYHGGSSETAFRDAVARRYPREAFTITDKMPMFMVKTKAMLEPMFQKELDRCGVEHFDYYWLHALNQKSFATCERIGAFEWMAQKQKEGKIIHTGFSFHDSAAVLDEILTKHPEVEYVQLQINYLDWEDEKVQSRQCYETAMKHSKRVMVMEPIKGGALANVPPEAKAILEKEDPALSPAVWALRFCASLDGVDFVLSGMSNLQQLQENTAAFQTMEPLTDAQKEMLQRVAQIIRSGIAIPCTGCRYCVDACPKGIAIPDYFAAYNEYGSSKKKAVASFETYAAQNGKPHTCIKCHACENHCPQNLPIAALITKVKDRFEL